MYNLLDKLPNAHPLLIGGGGALAVDVVNQLPNTGTISGIIQIVIGFVTIFKLIFPKKEKKEENKTPNTN